MSVVKEKMEAIIRNQPDDSTYEEIFKELAFARMIDRGLHDSRNGKTISNEDMKSKIGTWQK